MIEQIIDDNEKILWQGKPDFLLYVVGKPFIYLFAIIWAVLDGLLIPKFFEGAEFFGSPFLILFFVLHLFPVWLAILLPIYRAFNYRNIEYAVTDKRVYVSDGLFGRDISNIEHREISNLSVNVGVLENMKKVGTINLSYMGPYGPYNRGDSYNINTKGHQLISIPNPYEVYKLIKKVSLDVSTDQAFPNAYRPKENTGYETEYKEK